MLSYINFTRLIYFRSSIRLKSFSCGHSELNLIVSDMKELRSVAKQFTNAQETVWKDLHKWASRERNQAIKESFNHLSELNRLWTEVQTEFVGKFSVLSKLFKSVLQTQYYMSCFVHFIYPTSSVIVRIVFIICFSFTT